MCVLSHRTISTNRQSLSDVKLNKILWIAVCVCLALLVLAPLVYWKMTEEGQSFREPVNKYSVNTYHDFYNNETLSEVWNKTKNLKQVSDFSRYGNYSVLMSMHIYRPLGGGYFEWFIVASTLQPDSDGVIHELAIRFNGSSFYDSGNITLAKCYEWAHNFNLTPLENGKSVIADFVAQHESFSYDGFVEGSYTVFFPFLFAFNYPNDFGGTVILNLNTGEIMIAASSVWMGTGDLVYPEFIQDVGK